MLFRRIVVCALLLGALAGLLLSVAQLAAVSPIIVAAERFEAPVQAGHGHSHDHAEAEAWAPQDGLERSVFTVLSNLFAGIGFSAVLLALMAQAQLQGLCALNALKGLGWGLAGFAVFFAAPGVGLPPEIPGHEAAAIEFRQSWWLLAVLAAGAGIALLVFASTWRKLAGLVLLLMPHLIGAPAVEGPAFTHPDPAAVEALVALHGQFVWASAGASLLFWLLLGAGCGWVLNRWILLDGLPATTAGVEHGRSAQP